MLHMMETYCSTEMSPLKWLLYQCKQRASAGSASTSGRRLSWDHNNDQHNDDQHNDESHDNHSHHHAALPEHHDDHDRYHQHNTNHDNDHGHHDDQNDHNDHHQGWWGVGRKLLRTSQTA